ncbi:hypothetical protein [Patulibacter defluvii]|uniref:hypothetical protein n=1 Tax=Patulibacter defluvii TaxID=3095358 RepID=UPI002A74A464|nr:hypothetical protein [Patulibacter sp. DM4]
MATPDAPPPEPEPAPRARERRPRYGLLQAWSNLSSAQQRTAAAAVVVLVSLGAPWYTKSVTSFPGPKTSDSSLSAFGSFSFVEAAVLLVGAAVLALVWGRATERSFSLPFRDGTLVTAAAGWVGFLIVYRLFDHPSNETSSGAGGSGISTTIGLSWGIFASLAAVGLLLATGLDQRRNAPAAPSRARRRERERPVVDPRAVVDADGWETAPRRERRPEAAGPPAQAPDGRPRASTRRERDRDRDWDAPERPRPPRPAGGQDSTRALGREDAARLLRESGLDSGRQPPPARRERERPPHGSWAGELADPPRRPAADPAEDPTRHVPREDDPARYVPREDDPTRHVPREDDPARYIPREDDPTRRVPREDDPTRHVPRDDDRARDRREPPVEDPTRIAPARDERRERGRGRGRRRD